MLHELLSPTLKQDPDRPILEFGALWYSARQLDEVASTLASRFRQVGVEPIAILLPNCPEAIQVCLACFKGGFVFVPLDYRHKASQIHYDMDRSGAQALIIHHDRLADFQIEELTNRVPHVIGQHPCSTEPGISPNT